MTTGTVFVVDDHPLMRKGLCDAINAEKDLRICGEAGGYHETLQHMHIQSPGVLVLDLTLKDGDGWNLLQQLRDENRLPPTLVLSVCDEEVYAQRLLHAGARGYLMKHEPISAILEAIRKVMAGHLALSNAMISQLLDPDGKPRHRPIENLSNRELQVYELLCQGLSNKDIGERLGISHKTIGTYKARLMEKIGVRTTQDLMASTQQRVRQA